MEHPIYTSRSIVQICIWSLAVLTGFSAMGQEGQYLSGEIIVDSLGGLPVNLINLTSKRGTISRADGSFSIKAQRGDTILFSSVQYKPLSVAVTDSLLRQHDVKIHLEKSVNMLSEVHLSDDGLTGDLGKDLKKVSYFDQAAIGFPQLGKRRTPAERRLFTATSSSGGIPLDPLINLISGRLAMLRRQLKYEGIEASKTKAIAVMGKDFFVKELGIPENYIEAFIYYCSNSDEFVGLVHSGQRLKLIEFFLEKGKEYSAMWDFD